MTVWLTVRAMIKPTLKTARINIARIQVRIRRRVPPGLRLVLGIFLMLGGALGFLPVVDFWMIPLGVAVAALDIKPLYGWFQDKLGR